MRSSGSPSSRQYRAGRIVPFDWATWSQTAEGQRFLGEPRHVRPQRPISSKVLTTLVRHERFSEGTLSEALESGLLLAIARRPEALLEIAKSSS